MHLTEETYLSPFSYRYASSEMRMIFSQQFKSSCWRKLWLSLAKAEKNAGFPISDLQIKELETHLEEINWKRCEELEKKFKHDVFAHIAAFAENCPIAAPIIHLGATSTFVTDNTDLIQTREALALLISKLHRALTILSQLAEKYSKTSCLGFTHLQPAQPTTLGKRITTWIYDFFIDLKDWVNLKEEIKFLGVKGATGTQASFLALFNGDKEIVSTIEHQVAQDFNFSSTTSIATQTYSRKQDIRLLSSLASFAASAHKFATDIRLLSHMKEVQEPYATDQVGSSAMPHKQNPMRSERICSLSRYLISLSQNPLYTHATQWLERSLDDSANRRLTIPEAFLSADTILDLIIFLSSGLQFNLETIEANLNCELPLLLMETILMLSVKNGGNRQEGHEKLRLIAKQLLQINESDKRLQLLKELVINEPLLKISKNDLNSLTKTSDLTGNASEQTDCFIRKELIPYLESIIDLKSFESNLLI